MSKTFKNLWLFPLLLAIVVMLAFATIYMGLFSIPYYLGLVILYLVAGNLVMIAYIAARHRNQLLKVTFASIISLALAYLWVIQTA
jgi:general stress protein CsbA